MATPAVPTPNRLRELRQALDVTQEALAERAGVTVATVRAIETGKHPPSLKTALAIKQALGAGSLGAVFPEVDGDE
jgi:DNA-binding XRE family transcriptional regulator